MQSIFLKFSLLAILMVSTVMATNGDNLIAIGAKSRGMGGVGIAVSHGAESGIANPAMLTRLAKDSFSFGGTVFMPDVSFDNGIGSGAKSSAADMSVIPAVSYATKSSENFFWGVGMWGTAGMGVDYRAKASNFEMVTNLQLMQFGVPLAYKNGSLSVGMTPVLQYGALDMSYDTNTTSLEGVGSGVAQDLAFGFTAGISYDITYDLTLAVVYKSAIAMEYKGVISNAMAGFGQTGVSDILEQPAEMGAGLAFAMGETTFAIDVKKIAWSEAEGYKGFGWKDQTVVAVGYAYEMHSWTARLGYNYAKSPIEDQGLAGSLANTLNLLGFPATVESHTTAGVTIALDKGKSVDIAYVHALQGENTYTVMNNDGSTTRDLISTHSQDSVSIQLNITF